ncbi:M23 family metallopeptidase [Tellurirhabdus bombi]|uniref:M23 family metallopeptidase n=1 Tax=Tellurirhabdus bombi TaxID=2907205 RepID=UPI001F29BC25|nr:M23 family metallopeptidase [Tellurirhabdus bombi]
MRRKKRSYISLIFLLLIAISATQAQQAPRPGKEVLKAIQPGYFMFPIMPGDINSLSGAMGDLRANHFHAGIDIRTQQREGLAVHAAADGYISRIAVFTGGYGNVLFVKHPNGLTTVYGHLKSLSDPLATYLRENQYKKQTFEIDLRPEPGQFIVKKGGVIALSGNTGGSGGPHLHFEIRDEKNNLLNPLLFGFQELEDTTPPFFDKIALRPLTPTSRINGQASRVVLQPVKRPNGDYVLTQPVTASGLIGLEILAYDRTNGTPYKNGLGCIEIQLDDREVFAYNMDNFPNDQTRLINVHMDYATEQLTGQRYHRCYIADGNNLPLYQTDATKGKLPLFDGESHEVTITLFDSYQNSTHLRFTVKADTSESAPIARLKPSNLPTVLTSAAEENTLLIRARNLPTADAPPAILHTSSAKIEVPVAYVRGNEAVYVVDLNQYLPDSVQVGKAILPLNYRKRIHPGREETYKQEDVSIAFAPSSLLDTLHLTVKRTGNMIAINQLTVPLNDNIGVNFAPSEPVEDKQRTQIYQVSGGRRKYIGGFWKDDRFHFRPRELGTFKLLTDTNAPVAKWIRKDSEGLVATIKDDLSGLESFRMLVNGEWVLMQYDYKRALIWSDRLDRTKPFEGEVVLEVKDRAGNKTLLTANLPMVTAQADSVSNVPPSTVKQ